MAKYPEDKDGNYIFSDTDKCYAHYEYLGGVKCIVCSRRGPCAFDTRKRLQEEADKRDADREQEEVNAYESNNGTGDNC